MQHQGNSSTSFPFVSILTLIFITLKLTGYIVWSWWWVLSPLWIAVAIFLVMVVGIMALKELYKNPSNRHK